MDEPSRAWYQVGATTNEPTGAGSLVQTLGRNSVAVAAGATVVTVALAGIVFWSLGSAADQHIEISPLTDDQASAVSDNTTVIVDVAGAVRQPGLYRLPASSRVGDAITAAGGFGPSVDAPAATQSLNLAAPLSDGQKIVVPVRGGITGTSGTSAGTAGGPHLVDINRASNQELDTLPGVGPVTVDKIVAARSERPFGTTLELLERKIVGPATWEKIRDLVTAS